MAIDETPEAQKPDEQKPIEMIVSLHPHGGLMVSFPLLADRMASYGFLKLAEKSLDRHYAGQDKKMIEPVKGGIMNFARNRMGR